MAKVLARFFVCGVVYALAAMLGAPPWGAFLGGLIVGYQSIPETAE